MYSVFCLRRQFHRFLNSQTGSKLLFHPTRLWSNFKKPTPPPQGRTFQILGEGIAPDQGSSLGWGTKVRSFYFYCIFVKQYFKNFARGAFGAAGWDGVGGMLPIAPPPKVPPPPQRPKAIYSRFFGAEKTIPNIFRQTQNWLTIIRYSHQIFNPHPNNCLKPTQYKLRVCV